MLILPEAPLTPALSLKGEGAEKGTVSDGFRVTRPTAFASLILLQQPLEAIGPFPLMEHAIRLSCRAEHDDIIRIQSGPRGHDDSQCP